MIIVLRGVMQALYAYFSNAIMSYLHFSSAVLFVFILILFIARCATTQVPRSIFISFILLVFWLTLSMLVHRMNGFGDYIVYTLPSMVVLSLAQFIRFLHWKEIGFVALLVFGFQIATLIGDGGFVAIFARESRGQLGSLFGHANSFGLILSVISICVWFSQYGLRRVTLTTIIFILLLLVGARSVLIAVVISIGCSLVCSRWAAKNVAILLSCMFVASIVVVLAYGMTLVEQDWTEQSIASGNSLKWRVIHWAYYLKDLSSMSDWLAGFGLGAHEGVTVGLYDKYYEVHNDYIRIIYDVGLVGLGLYFAADYCIFKELSRKCVNSYWFLISAFWTKWFFMFFDNMVTNMMTIIGFYLVVMIYVYGVGDERSNSAR